MLRLCTYLKTSIGKKVVVGFTGLGLSLFVLMHMAGNMLILVGAETYNRYSYKMITNPLLYPAEIGLVVIFLVHVGLAIKLALENRASKQSCYHATPGAQKRATFASRSMILTGLLTLVFVVLHLWTFKYGPHYTTTLDGHEARDLYRLIVEKFKQPLYVGGYLFALVVLGLHLSHGVSGLFQSLGIRSSLYPCLRKTAIGFACIVALGFISQPLYIFFLGGN